MVRNHLRRRASEGWFDRGPFATLAPFRGNHKGHLSGVVNFYPSPLKDFVATAEARGKLFLAAIRALQVV
jgi:hypothetical protein